MALTKRWDTLRPHVVQAACYRSPARFNINHSGRRSGKTELLGKRKVVRKAVRGAVQFPDWRCFVGAPVRHQAKKIYWNDLKQMVPKNLVRKINESNLIVELINASEIHVLGMDRPERVEGIPWDHGLLDEYGNMKPDTWEEHVRPALSDRKGSCDFIGAPEGRNHYFDLVQRAKIDYRKRGASSSWRVWHWPSWEILDDEEIEAARNEMDSLIFRQEYGGEFISFSGQAYYSWDERLHLGTYRDCYNPRRPLVICFDFNVAPGTAVILQELGADTFDIPVGTTITTVIGEVYIPRNSNTLRVCRKVLEDWGDHEGLVICYGDSTGGNKGSAKVKGSDWDLIKQALTPHYGERLYFNVPLRNPAERQRVNAVNSRLLSMNGDVRMVVDGKYCPMTAKDLEGTRVIEGSAGELDKKSDSALTHLSDALGYYVHKEFPVGRYFTSEDIAAMMEDEYKEGTQQRMKAA
jgi:hypothetical protein